MGASRSLVSGSDKVKQAHKITWRDRLIDEIENENSRSNYLSRFVLYVAICWIFFITLFSLIGVR